MTNFEKSIKRGITREKFEKIRDHVYGDGQDIFGYRYGDVSSWLTWHRKENGQIASAEPPDYRFTARGSIFDGSLEEWDDRFASKITTDIVFLGLNMSGDGRQMVDLRGNRIPYFQNARGHRFIVKTFSGTEAEGGYFTDIIKPDRRLLDDERVIPAKARTIVQKLKENPNILRDHILLFKRELDFVGAVKPLLIVFGHDANWVLREGLDNNFLKERFYAVVEIYQYTYTFIPGGLEGYINDTREKLKRYITIP
jgi:hypothetical protein